MKMSSAVDVYAFLLQSFNCTSIA